MEFVAPPSTAITRARRSGVFPHVFLLCVYCLSVAIAAALPTSIRAEVSGNLIIVGNGPELTTIESLARAFEKANPRAYVDLVWDDHSKPVEMLKAGEAPYHEGSVCLPGVPGWTWECWGELTGESVDPVDDTGIWVTQEYPVPVPRGFDSNYANYSMWVGQVFGSGCGHGVCATGAAMKASCDSICVAPVCSHDAYCCNTAWDSICVSEVPTYCGGNTCNLSP